MDSLTASVLLNGIGGSGILSACTEKGLPPEDVVAGGKALWRSLGCTEKVMSLLAERLDQGWAEREIDGCTKKGVTLLTWGEAGYPEALRRLTDPPLVLYRRGPLSPGEGVGIVGTRKCSPYGRRIASELGAGVASRGGVVVSGGARGIDSAAHEGCLEAGGPTIAVLGTGIDRVYPVSNRRLFEDISIKGALVTEFPLGTEAKSWTFPRRNRIIAALSAPLVVVEAPSRSGAMITARLALEAGRDVWAVPGRISDALCRGSNGLIGDGAFPLVDRDEFLNTLYESQMNLDFGPVFHGVEEPPGSKKLLSKEEGKVYALLRESGGRTVDNIAANAKMSATDVLRILGALSVKGLARPEGAGRWSAACGTAQRPGCDRKRMT